MNSLGILAFGYGGIVIGALRHHGFVPWDSDVDFLVSKQSTKDFVHAVKRKAPLLAQEWGISVCKVSDLFYHWTSLPQIVNTALLVNNDGSDSSHFSIPKCPKGNTSTEVVPSVEISFTDLSTHKRVKTCSYPRDLRMMFTEGGVPFWTCDKLITKWTYEMRKCVTGWNQPTRDDQSCGKQIFAIPLSNRNNTNSSSVLATQSITTVANYSFAERYEQWKKLIDKSDLNPDGLTPDGRLFAKTDTKKDCTKLFPIYNFADVEETHTTVVDVHGRRSSTSGAIISRYARSIVRTIPLDDWACYSWKSDRLIPEEARMNTTAATTLFLSDDVFNVTGTFTRQLTRNYTLVVSERHRVLLDYYPPPTQHKEQNQTALRNLTKEEEKEEEEGVFCELHITTRFTHDDALWAKVMGYNCYKKIKDGKNVGSQQQSQYKWCHVRGDNRRRWTRIKDLELHGQYY